LLRVTYHAILHPMRGFLFAVGMVACAKTPAPPDEVARRVDVSFDNDRHIVTFGDSRMVFGATSQIEMPESLTIGQSAELLGDRNGCGLEKRAGLAVFPMVVASHETADSSAADRVESSLVVDAAGPGIARIEVQFSMGYTCGGAQALVGRSLFTFFPSNKVVRQDLDVEPTATSNDMFCGCGGSTFFFTSYWTFATMDAFQDRTAPLPEGNAPSELCYVRGPDTVGLLWRDTGSFPRRIAQNAVTYDWVPGQSTLEPQMQRATSVLVLANNSATCASALAATIDPPIMIDGARVDADDDGTYAVGELDVDEDFELTATSPMDGFALVLPERVDHVRVTRDSDGSVVGRHAQIHNDKTILWIDESIGAGETFTVEVLD
jgi:hypothetical protein